MSKLNIQNIIIVGCIISISLMLTGSLVFVLTLDDREMQKYQNDMTCSEIKQALEKYGKMKYNNYPKTTEYLNEKLKRGSCP